MKSDKTTKRAAAIGLTAGLVGGGAAGLVFGVPGLTTAADGSSDVTVTQAAPDTAPDTEPDTAPDPGSDTGTEDEDRADVADHIRESLQELVDDDMITADQADAVAEHLAAQSIGRGPGMRGDRPGGFGERGARILDNVDTLTRVLGIDATTLRDELRSGSTIAEVAEAHGVDVADVVAALVADAQDRIDQAVADGRIDADRAAEMSADLEQRITAHVNGEHPAFGRMGPGRGHHDDDGDGPDTAPDTGSAGGSTTQSAT
jgi:polyhydroxyalkanoate synthesis regulator phasin